MTVKFRCKCGRDLEMSIDENGEIGNINCECGEHASLTRSRFQEAWKLHGTTAGVESSIEVDAMADALKETLGGQTFRTVFVKQIHCCASEASANDAWIGRRMLLPFAPQPQMWFTDPDGWRAQASEVQWDGKMFVVYTVSEREIYNAQYNRRPGRDIAAIIKDYEDQGWALLGYGVSPPLGEDDA